MHTLNVAGVKLVRLLLPVAQKAMTPTQPPAPVPNATTYIPSPSKGKGKGNGATRRLKADIYLPTEGEEVPPSNARLAIVINMHGSGFCLHAHGSDAAFCSQLAHQLPAVVIDIDYSHAPEHAWPAPVEDVDAAIQWTRTFAKIGRKYRKKFGVYSLDSVGHGAGADWEWDESRIALTGFSAGGNLALVAASARAHINGGVQAVVAFYPSTNLSESPWDKPALSPDRGAGAAGGTLPPWLRYMLYDCYVPVSSQDRTNPSISPLFAPADSFPPSVTVITCEKDALAREAAALVLKLRDSHVYAGDALLWTAKGQGHNWDKMTKPGTDAAWLKDEAYRLTVRRIRAAFARVSSPTNVEEHEEEGDDHDMDGDVAFVDARSVVSAPISFGSIAL